MTTSPFEIPLQMRELAEKNVEHASAAYGQFMGAMSQAIDTWAKPASSNAIASNFKAVQDRALAYAKQNGEAGFALATEITRAKDLTELFSLQSKFAQAQMQAYVSQAQELGKLTAQAFQSIKP
jgi:hypothetical protein